MTRFRRAEVPEPTRRQIKEHAKDLGISIHAAERAFRDVREKDEVWVNDTYQVNIEDIDTPIGAMKWLSVKRRDKLPIHDWRDLQQIKNELVGPDHEGCELYPAESRRVDTANQYHLFVFVNTSLKFPFGYNERLVLDGTGEVTKAGSRQRPL